jgi:hypothetical protein
MDNKALIIYALLIIVISISVFLIFGFLVLMASSEYSEIKALKERNSYLENYSLSCYNESNKNYMAYNQKKEELNNFRKKYEIAPIEIFSRDIKIIVEDDIRPTCGKDAWGCAVEGINTVYVTSENTTVENVSIPTHQQMIDICNHEVLHLVLDLTHEKYENMTIDEEHNAMAQLDDIIKFEVCERM